MKIGVISDTHGSATAFALACKNLFTGVDLILHAGDLLYHGPRNPQPAGYDPAALAQLINQAPAPVVICQGNCDSEVDTLVIDTPIQAPYAYVMQDGSRIVMVHGQHLLTPAEKLALAKRFQADIFITGHTHETVLEKHANIILLNPGSPALSKRPDQKMTAALIYDDHIAIKDIHTTDTLAELPR